MNNGLNLCRQVIKSPFTLHSATSQSNGEILLAHVFHLNLQFSQEKCVLGMLSAEQQMVDMVGRILAESASVLSGVGGADAGADPQPKHVRLQTNCWFVCGATDPAECLHVCPLALSSRRCSCCQLCAWHTCVMSGDNHWGICFWQQLRHSADLAGTCDVGHSLLSERQSSCAAAT